MTTMQRLGLFGVLLLCGASASFAFAEPKQAPAKAGEAATCDKGAGADCCKHGDAKAGAGSCPMAGTGGCPMAGTGGCPMAGAGGCPMMSAAGLDFDAKVENTKQGAVLTLTAKNPAQTAKVQELAQKLAKHLHEGCPMMHGGHEGHGMKK